MKVEVIRNFEQFIRLKVSWEALFAISGESPSVFSSYGWYECWWRYYAHGAGLFVVVVSEGDEVVGIAPFMSLRTMLHGLPVKLICFIENGHALHCDFLFAPRCRKAALIEVIDFLYANQKEWDVVLLNNLPEISPDYTTLVELLKERGARWQQCFTFGSPFLEVTGTWSDYLSGLSPRVRKTLRNNRNTIERAGEVCVQNIRTWDEFESVKDDIFDVARSSWTQKIGDSMASPANRGFFEDLSLTAAVNGWLSVWTLRLNGRMIAFEYHLKTNGKQHAMRGSFASEFAHLSPGTFLEMCILDHSFQSMEGIRIHDFGGSFDSYKRKWTENYVTHHVVSMYNDRIYSRVAAFHEIKTVNFLRSVRDRARLMKSGTSNH